MTISPELLLGPYAALALALLVLTLFYAGRILSRSTVPREDYDRVLAINATYAEKFSEQTDAVQRLAAALEAHTAAGIKKGAS
jgi:hypothetical protein